MRCLVGLVVGTVGVAVVGAVGRSRGRAVVGAVDGAVVGAVVGGAVVGGWWAVAGAQRVPHSHTGRKSMTFCPSRAPCMNAVQISTG